MELNGLHELNLETIENAIAMETIDTEKQRSIKVFIPKLMPLGQEDIPKKKRINLNKQLIVNNKQSIPKNLNYAVYTTNYITVPLAGGSFYKTIINKGQRLYVMLPNKNFKEMVVIAF